MTRIEYLAAAWIRRLSCERVLPAQLFVMSYYLRTRFPPAEVLADPVITGLGVAGGSGGRPADSGDQPGQDSEGVGPRLAGAIDPPSSRTPW